MSPLVAITRHMAIYSDQWRTYPRTMCFIGVGCLKAAQSDALRVCGDAVTPARQESTDETRPPLAYARAPNCQAMSAPLTPWTDTAERLAYSPPQRFAPLSAREVLVPKAEPKRGWVDVSGKRGFVPGE